MNWVEKHDQWVKKHGLVLVPQIRFCAHVLMKRACPSSTRYLECSLGNHTAFDHGRVWQRQDGTRFLLAHVYAKRQTVLDNVRPIATARGLTVAIDDSMDWYGCGTVPLRFELNGLSVEDNVYYATWLDDGAPTLDE